MAGSDLGLRVLRRPPPKPRRAAPPAPHAFRAMLSSARIRPAGGVLANDGENVHREVVTEILLAAELNDNTRMKLWPNAIQ